MLKRIFLAFTMILMIIVALAQSKLTPYTQIFLQKRSEKVVPNSKVPAQLAGKSNPDFVATKNIGGVEMVETFITVNDDFDINSIKDQSVVVNARYGNIIAALVPVDRLAAIAESDAVSEVSVAHPLRLLNDSARSVTNAKLVQSGDAQSGLTKAYKGSGVIVGIVDVGIDFNHIAFKDANGVSRVKRVYLPNDKTGSAPIVEGVQLVGSEYTTPEQIAALLPDLIAGSHGTHTSGIAGGSYTGNDFYGMAPESDLILCGCGNALSDYSVSQAVKYIFHYADSVGKPAVVNLSLGDHYGPHDGSSTICKTFDQLSGPGKIIALSAGNEGAQKLHIYKKFTATDSVLQSLIYNKNYGTMYYNYDYFDFWTRNTDYKSAPKAQFFVINLNNDSILFTSPKFSTKTTFDAASDSVLSKYYVSGKIYFSFHQNLEGKFEILSQVDGLYAKGGSQDYCVGLRFYADSLTTADVWEGAGSTSFTNDGFSEYTDGDSNLSISDMALGKHCISVGAMNSKIKFTDLNNSTWQYSGTLGDISSFSSYGPDVNGETKPDILAPGKCLVSSINSYDTTFVKSNGKICANVVSGGRTYTWGQMSGTSMACPAAVGIIALWLQANPNLTAEGIKDVFKNTSIHDSFTAAAPRKSGFGKIDALAGLKYIINTTDVKGAIGKSTIVSLYPNPTNGEFSIYAPGESGNLSLSIYNIGGGLVYSKSFDASSGTVNVNLGGSVAPGIYIAHITGARTNFSSRLILK